MNEMQTRSTMNGKPVFTVPAKTIINFHSHFDRKLLCDGLTFNAGSACVYSCSFCYVEAMKKKQEKWFGEHGVIGEHMDIVIRHENPVEIARKQIMGKDELFRMSKKVIYSSTNVDVAGNMDLVRETVEMCKMILEITNWDIRLLSKSNLFMQLVGEFYKVAPELSDEFNKRMIFGVSTGTLDDKLAAAFEEGTAKVSKRIESLRKLQNYGFRTFGMICPSLPMQNYKKFASEIAEAIRHEKCEHIWAEVINVRGESLIKTVKALRDDGFEKEADLVNHVSTDKEAWEKYARDTFSAHVPNYPTGKLRFLQYTTKATDPWWQSKRNDGAIIL